jgi:hypothetical protein
MAMLSFELFAALCPLVRHAKQLRVSRVKLSRLSMYPTVLYGSDVKETARFHLKSWCVIT